MKAILLWNILFGVLASGLANDSHLEGNEVNEEIKSSATHHLSKRDIDLHGNFPGLGGNDLAGKVFTTTGSRITQSNNVLPTRNQKALSFINNPNVQQKEGINPALQANPLQQAINNNRALLASVTESKESDHLPLIHESVADVKHTPQDPPSSEKDSVNADATVNLARRGLVRRSLFEQQLLEKRELTSAADTESSRYFSFQVSQRNLGEFPALGGLRGTIASQEAWKALTEASKSSSGPKESSANDPSNVSQKPSGPQASGKLVFQSVE
ncbi:hypothetical protein PGT21_015319 [Puccinia graminis f. sp. tritici]|uniref:Uncharacterized protein n=1 Tax=Puccinia graminis f. sp. tritici TaxID=56615 RepID=A0A5B0N239_PUCGR|nr:hypothetical protein PGTUg99_019143 [Puccinia graminis f. sp. tritici]KAA1094258.1 hypothetical protein PGT21_015319 [Puccinia graminis f. sp. tritici]